MSKRRRFGGEKRQTKQVEETSETESDAADQECPFTLNDLRAELYGISVSKARPVDFKVSPRGGKWLQKKLGKLEDKLRSFASGKLAKTFCKEAGLKAETQMSLTKFGGLRCHALSLFWCRRLQHFFNLWLANGGSGFRFSIAHVQGGPGIGDVEACLQGLQESHVAMVKFRELEALRPRVRA